jgi:uncharacterized membrane protein
LADCPEVTILRLIFFSQISCTANPVILIILWAIGISMIGLAGLIYLPMRVIAAVSIAIITLHNLLDPVSAERFGRAAWIWGILHQQNVFVFPGVNFVIADPVLPWIGVMAGGDCLGTVFEWDAHRRRSFLLRTGLALAAAFVVVRAVNNYGDPLRWSPQASPVFTVLSFLNVLKISALTRLFVDDTRPGNGRHGVAGTISLSFHRPADYFRACAVLLLWGALAFGSSD